MAECTICDQHLSNSKADEGEYSCVWCGEIICDDCMEDHEDECATENARQAEEDEAKTKIREEERKAHEVMKELDSILGF